MNTNQKIFKYPILIADKSSIEMPTHAEILSMQIDQKTGSPCMWALVFPDNPKEERFFEVFGTGHEVRNDMGIDRKYLGTFQMEAGEFIGHVFERIN